MKAWVLLVLLLPAMLFVGAFYYSVNYSPGGHWAGNYQTSNQRVLVIYTGGRALSFHWDFPFGRGKGSPSRFSMQTVKCKRSNGQVLVYRSDKARKQFGPLYARARVIGYRRLEFIFQRPLIKGGPKRIIMERLSKI